MLFVRLVNILHPYLVKTQLSLNPINGKAIAWKPTEAPYKQKKKKKSNILKSVLQKLTRSKIVLGRL
jgi:hypothetical protein